MELSDEDLELIEDVKQKSSICKYMSARRRHNFNIGDILIKKVQVYLSSKGDYGWAPEYVPGRSFSPRRYIYIHEDENGVGFIKPISATSGKPLEGIECIADVIANTSSYFEIDQQYAESVLLGQDFSVKKMHAEALKKKKQVEDVNKSNAIDSTSIEQINTFLSTFPVGGTFYVSGDFTGTHLQEIKVKAIRKIYISSLRGWDRDSILECVKNTKTDVKFYYEVHVDMTSNGGRAAFSTVWDSFHLYHKIIYNSKPISLLDEL